LHFYNWKDAIYSGFMIEFLRTSEPRKEDKGIPIYKEGEDVQEVIFFSEGSVEIGFKHEEVYGQIMTKSKGIIIGDNECTFNLPSNYIWTSRKTCHGIFIRKKYWTALLEKYPDICEQLE
jgi:hypothetical protein